MAKGKTTLPAQIKNDAIQVIRRLTSFTRTDGWENLATGLGNVFRDKGAAQLFQRKVPKSFAYYSDLYHGDPIARRIAEIPPREMLRQGFRVEIETGDPSVPSNIVTKFKELNGAKHLFQAAAWSRGMGGSGIYCSVDDGLDPLEPLDLKRIRSVNGFIPITRQYLVPVEWYVDDARFGQPMSYMATIVSSGGVASKIFPVHESRIIRFDGIEGTPEEMQRNLGWGDSIFRQVEESLGRVNMSFAAISTMLADGSQGVLKIKGLIDQMADTVLGDTLIAARMALMDMARSVARVMVLDADDEAFDYSARSFAGVPESVDRMMLFLCGVTGLPATLLFGRSPAGMNATGDSDIRIFYDLMKSEQPMQLEPKLRRMLEIVMAAKDGPTIGNVPAQWSIFYLPLWQMNDVEQADVELKHAQKDAIYLEWGVTTPDEVANSRFGGTTYGANIVLDKEARDQEEESGFSKDVGIDGPRLTALLAVLQSLSKGEIPRETALETLKNSFGMDEDAADKLLADLGDGFEPTPPAPPPMLGAAPGEEPPKPGDPKPGEPAKPVVPPAAK